MCGFLSAIVKKDGEVLWDDSCHSHEDLIDRFHLRDDNYVWFIEGYTQFIRVEYTNDDDVFDLDTYYLHIDEEVVPSWFTEEMQERTIEKLKNLVKRQVRIDESIDILLGGGTYYLKDCRIGRIVNARIAVMKNCQASKVIDTQIDFVEDSHITYAEDSTLRYLRGETKIGTLVSSRVEAMSRISQIEIARESYIGHMKDHSKINRLEYGTYVWFMEGYSTVGTLSEGGVIFSNQDGGRIEVERNGGVIIHRRVKDEEEE